MRNYEAPALHILAVDAVDVLLVSHITNEGTGNEGDGGDVAFHAAAGGLDIFK